MREKLTILVATLAMMASIAPSVHAQEVLVAIGGTQPSPISQALRDLGIDFEGGSGAEDFLTKLRSQAWDLVVIQTLNRFLPEFEADILAELQAHVDRGGRLHLQIADLENLPEDWYDLLGLEGAVDLELPLSDIRAPLPVHPSVPGVGLLQLREETYPPDYGDVLLPGPDAYVTQWYEVGEGPSTVVSRNGRILVNGQQWDNWVGGEGFAAVQITWLLSCHADLDQDGDLTAFDFLEFQTLFDAGDQRADVSYDRRLDIFDFLEFLNQFEEGCA